MKVVASPFDSDHYGLAIARGIPSEEDDIDAFDEAIAEARQAYAVVFLRLPADHPLCGVLRERWGEPRDVLVTSTLLERRTYTLPASTVTIEHVDVLREKHDIDTVAAMTGDVISTSRYHADRRLDPARTRGLFADWGTKDVTGRAQRLVVAREANQIVGYIAALVRERSLVIDLVAVARAWHGRGVGSAMLKSLCNWLADQDLVATVPTQETNPALQLYARHGFVPTSRSLTWHLWLS